MNLPKPQQVTKAIPILIFGVLSAAALILIAAISQRSQAPVDGETPATLVEITPLSPATIGASFMHAPKPTASALAPPASDQDAELEAAFKPVPATGATQDAPNKNQDSLIKALQEAEEARQKRLTQARESKTNIPLPSSYRPGIASHQHDVASTAATPPGFGQMAQEIARQRDLEILQAAQDQAPTGLTASQAQQQFRASAPRIGYLEHSRQPRRAYYELKAGNLISATLLTGINTELAGNVTAIVNTPVLDTVTGSAVLIPIGTMLFGSYNAETGLGQSRLLIGFHRMQFPDGSTLQIGNMPAVDSLGQTGAKARSNNRFLQALTAASGLALITAGFQLTQPEGGNTSNDARQTLAAELGRQWSGVSTEVINKILSLQPTLKLKPGFHLHIMATQDIVLPPYEAFPAIVEN